jgi:hypothetical protein
MGAIVVLGLVALVAAVYFAVVLILGRTPTGGEGRVLVWAMLATAVAVTLAFPLRSWLTRLAKRMIYREQVSSEAALRSFGSHASRSIPLDELLLQAAESLRAIQTYADAVICFENDRMGEVVLPTAGVHDAFGRTDQVLGQCVRSVIDLVQRRGLIRLGFDDLLTALRNHDSRCLFGYGEAAGHDRAALALALLQIGDRYAMDGAQLVGAVLAGVEHELAG